MLKSSGTLRRVQRPTVTDVSEQLAVYAFRAAEEEWSAFGVDAARSLRNVCRHTQ